MMIGGVLLEKLIIKLDVRTKDMRIKDVQTNGDVQTSLDMRTVLLSIAMCGQTVIRTSTETMCGQKVIRTLTKVSYFVTTFCIQE